MRKLTIQTEESLEMVDMVDSDHKRNDEIKNSMVDFISKIFGHNSWERMVELRWLRNKANLKSYHYDSDTESIVAITYDGPDGKKKMRETAGSGGSLADKLALGYGKLASNADQVVMDARHRPSIKMDRLAEERAAAEQRKAINRPENVEAGAGHPSKWLGVLIRESKAKKESEAAAKRLKDAKINMFLDSSDEEETAEIRKAALADQGNYLSAIELSLAVEDKVKSAWKDKDATKARER